jgi:hypothetical protein
MNVIIFIFMNHFGIIESHKIKWKIYYMIIDYNIIYRVQQWQFYKERMVLHTLPYSIMQLI